MEATFPSQEDKERILKHDETRKWIKYKNLEFYPSGRKNQGKRKMTSPSYNSSAILTYEATLKVCNTVEDDREDMDITWQNLTKQFDDTELWLCKEELKQRKKRNNLIPPLTDSIHQVHERKEQDHKGTSGSKKKYVKTIEWHDALDDV
ncbi:hypothetical protein RclHR1_21480007 [Rhizophagus clarus]|uniref:Uncharacterized protein n=1 Tax=Rhizophagus clarus TaxID=94130 RepID=A0A2Z6R8K7_9GLOM|nr:hypothetical protein RclHR1_21480007 [Rhizophagus clarus]GES90038.1 hypothetical protein RCL_jg23822.t2 [Rhizophagus clarus]